MPPVDVSQEVIAIRHLVDTKGRTFTLAFFPKTVTEHSLACLYHGRAPDDPAQLEIIKAVLRERLTLT